MNRLEIRFENKGDKDLKSYFEYIRNLQANGFRYNRNEEEFAIFRNEDLRIDIAITINVPKN